MTVSREQQLELFDVANQPASKPHRELWGRLVIQMRHDQLILAGIGSLIVLTVIFAGGVERGKELARSEQRRVLVQQPQALTPEVKSSKPSVVYEDQKPMVAPKPQVTTEKKSVAKTVGQNTQAPSKNELVQKKALVSEKSRYIIQVATYNRPNLAQQELQRIHARGERAFLILRDGRAVVNVGPFPSRDHASKKLAGLKTRYQDCFVKTL